MTESPPVISIKDVSFSYGRGPALENVRLEVEQGEFLGIVGPSGGGKTTLLKLMLGLLKPDSGTVKVLGDNPSRARLRVGYVSQFVSFRRDFPISVNDTVLLGRLGIGSPFGRYSSADRLRAEKAMEEVEVSHLAGRPIGALSGGELQRVLIARALACDPEILVLDEPTTNVDVRMEEDIFDVLKKLNARITVILVSHDLGFITQYVTHVACLNRSLVCHPTSALTGEVIEELYGRPIQMIHHNCHDHSH